MQQSSNPLIAAILSFVIPGAGQIYAKGFKEGFKTGVFWLIFVSVGYVFLFIPGLLLHFLCVALAFSAASSASKPLLGGFLTAIVLFAISIAILHKTLPPEAREVLSFITNSFVKPDAVDQQLTEGMEDLSEEMEDMMYVTGTPEENQKAAIAALKKYAEAEMAYMKIHKQYSNAAMDLVSAGLLSADIAKANVPAPGFDYHGYYFVHVRKQADAYVDLTTGFVICAAPIRYKVTGLYTYVVGPTGSVLAKDNGGQAVTNASEVDGTWKSN